MVKIGSTALDKIPQIALVISDQEPNKTLEFLSVNVLEIRIDKFKNFEIDYIKKNISERRKVGIPLILTVRNMVSEGGTTHISDDEKMEIFKAMAKDVDALDIALKSPLLQAVIRLAKKNNKTVIVSSHDFEKTPQDSALENIFSEAVKEGADIVKIAAQANSPEDVERLKKFTVKHKKDNVITIALGDIGAISRVVFPEAGSLLTYSYVGQSAAPGQMPLEVLQKELCRYYPGYDKQR